MEQIQNIKVHNYYDLNPKIVSALSKYMYIIMYH